MNLAAQREAFAVWASRVGSRHKIQMCWLVLSDAVCRCERQSAHFEALREWRCSGVVQMPESGGRRRTEASSLSRNLNGWSRGEAKGADNRALAASQGDLFSGSSVEFRSYAALESNITANAAAVSAIGGSVGYKGGGNDERVRLLEEEIFRHSERDMQRLEHLARSRLAQDGHGHVTYSHPRDLNSRLENGSASSQAPSSKLRGVSVPTLSSRHFGDESLAGGYTASSQNPAPSTSFSALNHLLRSPDVREAPWDGRELLGTPS